MNTENSHIDIDTFAKYLAKELNSQEINSFETWIAASDENAKKFNSYKKIWNATVFIKAKRDVDVDLAWNKISSELFDKEIKTGKSRSLFVKFMSVAASVAIIGFFATKFFSAEKITPENLNKTIVTLSKEQKTLVLEDNSKVFLNQNSSLQYCENYKKYGTREVILKGEAFFEVTRNEKKPFIIKTDHGDVEVLGTSFLVSENSKALQVSVESGKVKLTSENNDEIILSKGESGIYSFDSKAIIKSNISDCNYISWKTKHLVFNDIPLQEVISSINKSYYSNIILGSTSLNNCLVNAEFSNKPLETVIKVISTTFDLTVEKSENGQIILSGSPCE